MPNNNRFLDQMQGIVQEHYSDDKFGVSELVEIFGMSRSQVHRKLKSASGQSISQFIREFRLDKAQQLLLEDDLTASEVAYRVGFSSPTYFNTCYHEYFGYPPGEAKLQREIQLKSVTNSATKTSSKITRSSNKSLIYWFLGVVIVISGFFIYKYIIASDYTEEQAVQTSAKTIAVLPLKNWSGDVELEYVSDGMTDAIISKLTEIKDIDRVIPFTSMIRYKDSQKDLQEIAKELDVAYVLEGNFKLSGTKVQSNLKLIDASTLEHVWNLEYTGKWKTDDIFEMQAEVAENVANTMSANVGSDEINTLQYQATTNVEAYRTFLEAEYQFNKLSGYGIKNAIDLYKQAIDIDSTFIAPYQGLATSYMISGLVWGIIPQDKAWSLARPILEKAMTMNSLHGGRNIMQIEAQFHSGLFYYELDIQAAERYFSQLIENNVDLSATNFAFDFARKTGRWSICKDITEKDMARTLATGDAHIQLPIIYFMLGEKEKAKDLLKISDPLQQDNYFYLQETSKWYFYMGEIEKSRKHLDRMLEQFEDRPPINYWLTAIHSRIANEDDKLAASLSALQTQFAEQASGSPAWFLALYYFYVGENDTGFEWLQKSYKTSEVEMTWLKEEPLLQSLKDDPRYISLYNKMGFQNVNQKLLK